LNQPPTQHRKNIIELNLQRLPLVFLPVFVVRSGKSATITSLAIRTLIQTATPHARLLPFFSQAKQGGESNTIQAHPTLF
jgi:hypothetical protein